ncbi:MAG: cyclase family protein, partial [Candidatus Jordarchaeaceae archaeon]
GAGDSDLPDGLGWANDTIKLQTHTGTHLDAPWHYFPTSEGKKPAKFVFHLSLYIFLWDWYEKLYRF